MKVKLPSNKKNRYSTFTPEKTLTDSDFTFFEDVGILSAILTLRDTEWSYCDDINCVDFDVISSTKELSTGNLLLLDEVINILFVDKTYMGEN